MSSRFNEKSEEEKQRIRMKISESQKARLAKRTKEDKARRSKQQRDYMNNRTEQQKQQAIQRCKETMSRKSEEEIKNIYRKQSESCKKTWANKSEQEMIDWSEKQRKSKNSYSEDKKQNIANKKREFWVNYLGNMTTQERQEFDNVRKAGFQKFWNNLSDQEKQQWRIDNKNRNLERYSKYTLEDKIAHSNRCKQAYELMSPQKKQLIQIHKNMTYKKNNSYGKSKLENCIFSMLIDKCYDVCRQPMLDKYKYDFCVADKSKNNTYIEINGSFWHNRRPFIECEEHIKEYDYLKTLNRRYQHIADVWRYDDTNKYNYCKEHNINFIRIYIGKNYNLDVIVYSIINNLNNGQVTLKY